MIPKVTLDQWRVLQSIIDEAGFAQAAEALHRSQSSVSYAARRLQETLGVKLLEIQGRRALLTSAGQSLLLSSVLSGQRQAGSACAPTHARGSGQYLLHRRADVWQAR